MNRGAAFLRSLLDPRSWFHALRLVHYYHYTHVAERGRVAMGRAVQFAPNVSLAHGERVAIGDRTHIGARCSLWAGPTSARITIGRDCLFGPEVFLTAANYGTAPGLLVLEQPRREADIVIGDDVWLGAGVLVVAGVTIGDGCIVGGGSVVTRSLPPGTIAAGVPARVVALRSGRPVDEDVVAAASGSAG
ncbi:MAG: transferase hexapeptide repeat containing protein [Acidimicrobiales bacterium]|jgi:acetyltransferase-like isoleucine patch superfamily enzyme|nr:transferase hexapeptide repeat containing protein [Acidimicrobiales bacterium]